MDTVQNQNFKKFKYFQFICEFFFIKENDWREGCESFEGIAIYSQILLKIHSRYKILLLEYIEKGYIEPCYTKTLYEGKTVQSYNVSKGLCKNYRITKSGKKYYTDNINKYDKCEENLQIKIERKITVSIRKALQKSFDESLIITNKKLHKTDNRYHTKWCVVPKDFRNSFRTFSKEKMLFDMDISCAFPSMLCEILNNTNNMLEKYLKECNMGENEIDKKEISLYTKFVHNCDFYEHIRMLSNTSMSRNEIKKEILAIYNSDESQFEYKSQNNPELYKFFKQCFPTILKSFSNFKKNKTYTGAVLAKLIETPLMKKIHTNLKSTFGKDLKFQYLFDGIEAFGKEMEIQKKVEIYEQMTQVINDSLKDYKYITISLTIK
jgi:hypothetical protein